MIDLRKSQKWVAFAITGVMTIPPIGLGMGPDLYILQEQEDCGSLGNCFKSVSLSYKSFGVSDPTPLTLGRVKIILIPMKDVSAYGIKVSLMVADLALSVFNKKVPFAKTRLIEWHRRDGVAVGSVYENGTWKALDPGKRIYGPGLIRAPEQDFWDLFLNKALTQTLSPLGNALHKCMEWHKESGRTANVTHQFAFSWIGMESMLPATEKSQAGAGKRFPILIGVPSKYYGSKFRKENNLKLQDFLTGFGNPYAGEWKDAIANMYNFRCEVLHEGGTDFTSDIDASKIDWYAKLAEFLCDRLISLGGLALSSGVDNVDDFWETFIPNYLLSVHNHWLTSGVFFGDHLINFQWKDGLLPNFF